VASERFVGKVCVVNGAASEIGNAIAAALRAKVPLSSASIEHRTMSATMLLKQT
jgi:NAD(P)-dependent dehydrogenase (short-subunit alcohol dehydrogenase family)